MQARNQKREQSQTGNGVNHAQGQHDRQAEWANIGNQDAERQGQQHGQTERNGGQLQVFNREMQNPVPVIEEVVEAHDSPPAETALALRISLRPICPTAVPAPSTTVTSDVPLSMRWPRAWRKLSVAAIVVSDRSPTADMTSPILIRLRRRKTSSAPTRSRTKSSAGCITMFRGVSNWTTLPSRMMTT